MAKTAADGGCVEQLGLRGVAKVHLPPGHARCQAPAPQSAVARGVEPEPVFAGTTESMEVTPDPIALLDDSYGVLGP